jgi:hypothetical protein
MHFLVSRQELSYRLDFAADFLHRAEMECTGGLTVEGNEQNA